MTPDRLERIRYVLDRRQPDLTVVVETVHKAHNFSALLRSCDAVGVFEAHAVMPGGQVKVSRMISAGVGKYVRLRVHPTVEQAVDHVKSLGMRILVAQSEGEAPDYRSLDYTAPTAILFGQEKKGVSPSALRAADGTVQIPMFGIGTSLNISVAAALVLFEAQRQRRRAGFYQGVRLDRPTYDETLFEWGYPRAARHCRKNEIPYPELDESGQMINPDFPR